MLFSPSSHLPFQLENLLPLHQLLYLCLPSLSLSLSGGSHPMPELSNWKQEEVTPSQLPAVCLQRGQCIPSRQGCHMYCQSWKCTSGGKGIWILVSEAVSETHTTTACTAWKGFPEKRRNVLLRFITYKQSVCSPWPSQPPLQTNPSKEIRGYFS